MAAPTAARTATEAGASGGAADDRRASTRLLAAIAIVTVAPLFCVEFLPFTDLPEHVAVMATLRHWFDPAWRIREHYVLALGDSQYLLYHATGALLTFVFGSAESANRWMLAAVGVSYPFALRSLLRAMRRDERLALFGCSLFWNRATVIGFLPYVASLPLFLYALAIAVREGEEPRVRRTLLLAVLATAIFYMHASAFTLLVVIAPSVVLASRLVATEDGPWRLRLLAVAWSLPRRLVWLAPSAALAAGWALFGGMTLRGASLADDGEIARMSSARSAHAFTLWAHDVWWSHVDDACAVAFWLLFFVLLVSRVRAERRLGRVARVLDPAYVPFLCTAALYFLLPFRIGGGTMLNVRLAPVLAMFAILGLPAVRVAWDAWVLRGVAAISIAVALDAAHEMHAMNREDMVGFDDLIAKSRTGARLVTLSFRIPSRRTHFPPWVHVGAYHRARKGGVASFSFTELRHWPLHYVPEAAPPRKRDTFWDFNPCLFHNAEDGPYYDYVLVRGDVDPFRDRPPGPAWRKIGATAEFSLFEKVEGESYAPWPFPDEGPCRTREEAAKHAAEAASE